MKPNCVAFPLEVDARTTCVWLKDGTKISISKNADGRVFLVRENSEMITAFEHGEVQPEQAATNAETA